MTACGCDFTMLREEEVIGAGGSVDRGNPTFPEFCGGSSRSLGPALLAPRS